MQYRLVADAWSVNTADWSICSDTILIENPEFVYVDTDSQNRILWGIKIDGTIYYGAGVPPQIIDYINNKITELSLDKVDDIVAFLNDLLDNDLTLKEYLDDTYGKYIENPEWIDVKTDSEDKILEGIKTDGTKVIEIPLEIQGVRQETINNPEWIDVKTDFKGRILEGITSDGNKVQYTDVIYPNGIPSQIAQFVKQSVGRKNIKALFIGNSVNQDHITYLPWLLKNTYPELDFEIYIAYIGGIPIKNWVNDIIPNNGLIDIFSIAKKTEAWMNINKTDVSPVRFNDIFSYGPFDLISYEGYFYFLGEDYLYFKQFTDAVQDRQNSPFKFGYLMHQAYGHTGDGAEYTEENIWNAITNGAEQAILTTPVDVLFPCGAVTKQLLGTFGQSFLTSDSLHQNEGLPCIMGAYVVMEVLADYIGLKSKVINNQMRISVDIYNYLHIPGANGTLKIGNELQYKQAQEAAIKSVLWGKSLLNEVSKQLI